MKSITMWIVGDTQSFVLNNFRERERERERDRQTDRLTDRQTDRQPDRQRQRESEKDRDKETETEKNKKHVVSDWTGPREGPGGKKTVMYSLRTCWLGT